MNRPINHRPKRQIAASGAEDDFKLEVEVVMFGSHHAGTYAFRRKFGFRRTRKIDFNGTDCLDACLLRDQSMLLVILCGLTIGVAVVWWHIQ